MLTSEDLAVFEDPGYLDMYHKTARQIAERKDMKPRQCISDFMGTTEMAANGYRAALASEMLVGEDARNKVAATRTHYRAWSIVRGAIEDAGVLPFEQLPTLPKSIQEIKHEFVRRQRIEEEDRIGRWAQLMAPTNETLKPGNDPSSDGGVGKQGEGGR